MLGTAALNGPGLGQCIYRQCVHLGVGHGGLIGLGRVEVYIFRRVYDWAVYIMA